ncbi:MAG: class I SAM-dependent methyltransferase [Cytophagales bacterium]|nr:class I SAM-dependent methyltransferase [Cytophagales bacterium]
MPPSATIKSDNYYDAVAKDYNELLESKAKNAIVRNRVAEYIQKVNPSGPILDFGGGTGMDLPWLSLLGQKIYFCEPSSGMRKEAELQKNTIQTTEIQILGTDSTDFTKWKKSSPFDEGLGAILANFAVLNHIDNLKLLFENLAFTLNDGGSFFALVLSSSTKWYSLEGLKNFTKQLLKKEPPKVVASYQNHSQIAYLHSIHSITSASAAYFKIEYIEEMALYGFTFIHLKKR